MGIVERLIRTLQEMMALNIHELSSKKQYRNEFKRVLKIYNNQYHSSIRMSPAEFLNSTFNSHYPWETLNKKNENFDYFTNRKIIRDKLKKMKKKLPLMTPVRLYKKIKKNYKKSHLSTWSDEIYFVDGYKTPLLADSDIGIYLKDKSGDRKNGITYSNYVKIVKEPDYMKIKNVISYMVKKQQLKCSFVNYPPTYYMNINLSDLNKFIIPRKLRKKIEAWRKKHGI